MGFDEDFRLRRHNDAHGVAAHLIDPNRRPKKAKKTLPTTEELLDAKKRKPRADNAGKSAKHR